MAKDSENSVLHNVIAQGTRIVGDIDTSNDMRLDGSLQGNMICHGKVVIGPQGSIIGNLDCDNCDIMGSVDGKLNVADTLSLKATANITGEIHTKILSIEPNAVFNGTCEMLRNKEQ